MVVSPTPTPTEPSPLPTPEALTVGALLQVGQSAGEATPTAEQPLVLWNQPDRPKAFKTARVRLGLIPAGSVLQLASRQAIADRGYWLKLKVCSVPPLTPPTPVSPSSPPATATLQPGETGWIEQNVMAPFCHSKSRSQSVPAWSLRHLTNSSAFGTNRIACTPQPNHISRLRALSSASVRHSRLLIGRSASWKSLC